MKTTQLNYLICIVFLIISLGNLKAQNTKHCGTTEAMDKAIANNPSLILYQDQLEKYIIDGIKSKDIAQLMVKSAINLITMQNTHRQYIAGRLTLIDIYKQAANNRKIDKKQIYSDKNYLKLFEEYITNGLYYKDFFNYYSKEDILKA